MTLTVVVGSSGSGKTTFLNDTVKSHKCTYIRQYHNIRPYVVVNSIPNFDPKQLPYWDIYEKEAKDKVIQVGGTMSGQFTAGLSGGQRKLLLFELMHQRTSNFKDLLLVLDEPFAGVTDDFVPWIVSRLNEMSKRHNILLVTNDHVEILKEMADNTIAVSAIDRCTVSVNGLNAICRDKVILALSVGNDYAYHGSAIDDVKFFFDVEVLRFGGLLGVVIFTILSFSLFLITFWNSNPNQTALVYTASNMVAFFCLYPYLLTLADWRTFMNEEAEALLHSSKTNNKTMKSSLTVVLLVLCALTEWGCVNGVVDGFEGGQFFVGFLIDAFSLMSPYIFFGLYTKLPFEAVQMFSEMPFLCMIFFSTTFSPGAGMPGLKELRYLFTRFYLFCRIPEVQDSMEGCPDSDLNTFYLILSGLTFSVMFAVYKLTILLIETILTKNGISKKNKLKDAEFRDLQVELYGRVILDDSVSETNYSSSCTTNIDTGDDFV